MIGRRGQHLRSRQARRGLDRDRLARAQPARHRRAGDAAQGHGRRQRLGFTPNAAAKNLRTLRTRKLLVTVPDISNPFFSLILQGIEDAAQREGYAVLVGDTQHDQKREERYALMLRRKEADGLIFLGHRLPKQAARLVRAMPRRAVRRW